MTIADILLMRTGLPAFTIAAGSFYALLVVLCIPGIGREFVLSMTQPWAYEARKLWARLRLARDAYRQSRRRRMNAPAASPVDSWAVMPPHPARVACANPSMCDDCRTYAAS